MNALERVQSFCRNDWKRTVAGLGWVARRSAAYRRHGDRVCHVELEKNRFNTIFAAGIHLRCTAFDYDGRALNPRALFVKGKAVGRTRVLPPIHADDERTLVKKVEAAFVLQVDPWCVGMFDA